MANTFEDIMKEISAKNGGGFFMAGKGEKSLSEALQAIMKNKGGVKPSETATGSDKMKSSSTTTQPQPKQDDEPCYCSECLNFDNFEKVLSAYPNGKFENTTFTVNGKTFNVKYWADGKFEHMTVTPAVAELSLIDKLKAEKDKVSDKLAEALNTNNLVDAQRIISEMMEIDSKIASVN